MAINSLNPLPRKTPITPSGTVKFGAGSAWAQNLDSMNANSTAPSTYSTAAPGTTFVNGAVQPDSTLNGGANVNGSGVPVGSANNVPVKPQTAYQKLLADRLAGNDPNVINAQNQQNTDTAASRYLALKTGNQNNLDAGFAPGSLQSQRGLDRTQATAEEGILQGQDRVNALKRGSSEDAITASQNLDNTNYARSEGLINSIADPKARQAAQSLVNSGTDPQEAYNQVIGSNGTVNTQYQSQTAAATDLQGISDTLKLAHPDWTPDQVDAAARKQLGSQYDATTQPLDTAAQTRAAASVKSNFKGTDFTQGDAKAYLDQLPDGLPISTNATPQDVDAYANAHVGDAIKIDGKPYQIQGANLDWINDGGQQVKALTVTNQQGQTVYIGQNGKQYLKGPNGYTNMDGTPLSSPAPQQVTERGGKVLR